MELFETLARTQLRRFPEDFLPFGAPLDTVELPEGKARLFDPADFYDAHSIAIGGAKITLRHRGQAELAKIYCDMQHVGFVKIPVQSTFSCLEMMKDWTNIFGRHAFAFFCSDNRAH